MTMKKFFTILLVGLSLNTYAQQSVDSLQLKRNLSIVLGTEAVLAYFLGITNPFVLVGGLLAAILGGGFTGDAAMRTLKRNLSDALANNISAKATDSTEQIVNSISKRFDDITNDVSSAIDNEIKQTEEQVNGIIEEMQRGQANIDARKQVIASCETRIKEISENLDTLIFELLGH